MPKALPPLSPLDARRLLLAAQALAGAPRHTDLSSLIRQLGFVQLDSINVLERAHHLTLGSRLDDYRPEAFDALLEGDRFLFEHWTHDASAIPLDWYPHWKHAFARRRERILASAWWRERVGEDPEAVIANVLERIRAEGPLRSADFEHAGGGGASAWWGWKPAKAALEFLWHTGELAVARRDNFHKVYDLPGRVFPAAHALSAPGPEAHLDWACGTALERLGVATPREIAAFWAAVEPAEAARWCAAAHKRRRIAKVEILLPGMDPRPAFAVADWEERLAAFRPVEGIRLLSPFDPVLRDRDRALRLFGFDYRFEAFVPAAKRAYGYYVLPILEGEALTGRLDAKLHRERGLLEVKGLWWEKGVRPAKARFRRLEAALEGLARRVGARELEMPEA